MSLATSLHEFGQHAAQCDALIANAHQVDSSGVSIFPSLDRSQITVAAFLNLFVAWESFIEDLIAKLLSGSPTIDDSQPVVRFANPLDEAAARVMIIGTHRYFDYANHVNVRRIVKIYFANGYPFEPHLSGVLSELDELRTMRNSAAHISSTTQAALGALCHRILGTPQPGMTLYDLLLSNDPRSTTGNTVFAEYRDKLLVTAGLIASG